jgi:hypothetical protein
LNPRAQSLARREYTPEDLQTLQNYEEKTNEAIMILEANADVLTSLRTFYERMMENKEFQFKQHSCDDIRAFAARVEDMVYDSRMQISRAKLLVRITSDRKSLVKNIPSLCPLCLMDLLTTLQVLQHLQSQATEKMEALTTSMHKIGVMSQKEAIAMRIITVVTLVYLPATFVSVSLQHRSQPSTY